MARIRPIALSLTWLVPCLAVSAGSEDPPRVDRLRERVEALLAPIDPGVTVAVAFRDLETGREFLVKPDLPIHPASTMKVPVMMEVFRRATAGKLSPRRPAWLQIRRTRSSASPTAASTRSTRRTTPS